MAGRGRRGNGGPGRRIRLLMSTGEQEDIQVVAGVLSRRPEAEVNAAVFSDTSRHLGHGVRVWECGEELG